ncbi:LysR family transcriptional regulator [Nesterenkonia sp. CL21]|uniref:LysR family transcriptional regulator n=1 Tax=Nesterenkonia sp. CL21 TaxID=3064894 RepID=UPI002878BC78|nr:LysR family transcriptional regulator [Nesterenkonia sp. CL21]MDS2171463.1 LysR family transcriptional regulator [Nesterenkonia sp. CL21]
MPMDAHRLLVLRAVSRTGSVAAAGRALHLTPSAVSQHLARLEAEAKVEIIDRTKRGGGRPVTFTVAGRALAEQAENIAQALVTAERELDRYRHRRHGTVRIGGFASVLTALAAPVVANLAISDPEIEPEIYEVDEDEGIDSLRTGALDLLLAERTHPDREMHLRGLQETFLQRDPYRVVVPAAWPFEMSQVELLSAPWVTSDAENASRRTLEQLCAENDLRLHVAHRCRESGTMLSLVAAGLGAALVPQLTLNRQMPSQVRLDSGRLEVGARGLSVLRTRTGAASPTTSYIVDQLIGLATHGGSE